MWIWDILHGIGWLIAITVITVIVGGILMNLIDLTFLILVRLYDWIVHKKRFTLRDTRPLKKTFDFLRRRKL